MAEGGPTEPKHIIPSSATQFTASATCYSHRGGCKAVSPAARESVTALALGEMKEGRAKTEEGPHGRPMNTLTSPASGVIRGGGIVL